MTFGDPSIPSAARTANAGKWISWAEDDWQLNCSDGICLISKGHILSLDSGWQEKKPKI